MLTYSTIPERHPSVRFFIWDPNWYDRDQEADAVRQQVGRVGHDGQTAGQVTTEEFRHLSGIEEI